MKRVFTWPGRRWRRVAIAVVVLVALFGIVGAWVLPPYVRHVAVDTLSAKLGRTVAIDAVTINPYTLKATVSGMRIFERDGKTVFAEFENLLVDASASTLFRLAPVLDAISLTRLRVNAVPSGTPRIRRSPAE